MALPASIIHTASPLSPGESTGLGRSIVLTPEESQLVAAIVRVLAEAAMAAGLHLYLRSQGRTVLFYQDGVRAPLEIAGALDESRCDLFAIKSPRPIDILIRCLDQPRLQPMVKLIVQQAHEQFEAKEREEMLMEEVASAWDSLYALRDNAEIFASTTITEGVGRLIKRIASLRDGFDAALLVQREAGLEYLACTRCGDGPIISGADLGPLQGVMSERRTIVLNGIQRSVFKDAPQLCWQSAHSLAAVPMLTREATRGFLVVWSEIEQNQVDTSFQQLIDTLGNRVSLLLECDSLTNAARHTERLQQELQIASTIQDTLLCGEVPRNLPGIEMGALSKPSQTIDGDFYDFYRQRDGSIDILIGDVMGKGVAAALLGTAVKNQFTKAILEKANGPDSEMAGPDFIVRQVSRMVNPRLIDVERFVTLCYARLHPGNRRLDFVDCGHTNTIVHRKRCGQSFILQGDSLPLGVDRRDVPSGRTIEVLPGDTIVFYSDGVTENVSAAGELFGLERLTDCVEQWSACGPDMLLKQLCSQASQHCGKPHFSDDFTAVAVRIRLNQDVPLHSRKVEFPRELQRLAALRAWLEELAGMVGESGLGEDSLNRLQLICVEAFDNCVIHGGMAKETMTISIEGLVFADSLKITIRHHAPAFDPFGAPPPSFDGSRDGGFGLYIMLRSADEFVYRREADGTNVISFSVLEHKEGDHVHAVNHYSCS